MAMFILAPLLSMQCARSTNRKRGERRNFLVSLLSHLCISSIATGSAALSVGTNS